MTEDGKKKYFDYKDSKFTKIGVIGSENRGKSTILSDFSKIDQLEYQLKQKDLVLNIQS